MTLLPPPAIVVPGIAASSLRDDYQLSPDNVWTAVVHKHYQRTTLHPQDLRFEAHQPSRISAGNALEVIYEDLIEELRHELSAASDRAVPVYPFAYDWRRPLDEIETQPGDFAGEVIDRTNCCAITMKTAMPSSRKSIRSVIPWEDWSSPGTWNPAAATGFGRSSHWGRHSKVLARRFPKWPLAGPISEWTKAVRGSGKPPA